MQDKFARLKALQNPSTRTVSALKVLPRHFDDESHGIATEVLRESERLAQILGASTKQNQYGEYFVLRCWLAEPTPCAPSALALRLLAPDAPECVADPRQWLFLDTETTGLAGGSGTYTFLVGLAWWAGGGLEVEQFFLREYSEERSLLAALAERLAERPVLVTFNGKSFDWPLLQTRYRMTRSIPPTVLAHLDFLHPARSIWRLRLGSVRLEELERQVLGWNRGTDVASERIPQIYLDFVRGGSPEPLIPIFYHNQMDLRALAELSGRILSLLDDPERHGQDALELYGVSRMCDRRGETDRARKLYGQSISSVLPAETDRAAGMYLARLAKRDGDFVLARQLWEKMLGNTREGYEAFEELAVYFEHQLHQPQSALVIVRKALDELRLAKSLGTIGPSLYSEIRAQFEHRLVRLEHKSSQSWLDLEGAEPLSE
jgi:uncharacterized protein YprB with RNaseH-like and TPR domain